jgi:hypothetical protein
VATATGISRLRAPAGPLNALDLATKAYVDAGHQSGGNGSLRSYRLPVSWGRDSGTSNIAHSGFPSVVQRPDGVLYMVVRRGSDHSTTKDGGVWYTTSSDQGRTWAAPTQLLGASGGTEYRDPCVSLSTDGTKIYLTYFKGSAANGGLGVFFRYSTDGGATYVAEVRVDGSRPFAASSAPAVELSNGNLVIPWYGNETAEANQSVYVAVSTNAGSSWTQTRIFNGVTLGTHMQEPWITKKPGADNLFMTYRYGANANIGNSTSSQTDGLGWSAAAVAFAGSGRPACLWLSTGDVLCGYRDSSGQLFLARLCTDPAAFTWQAFHVVRRTPTGGLWNYGHPIELTPGVAVNVFAEEISSTTVSKVYVNAFARNGGLTPFGTIPSDTVAIATDYDLIEYATNFRNQPSGATALGSEWSVLTGGFSLSTDGYLMSTTADGNPDRATVDLNTPDLMIEADIFMTVQSGAAILFRVVDSNNFLMWTVESSGTTFRFYKVVSGTPTQLVSQAAGVRLGSWARFKVVCRGEILLGYRDDQYVTAYTLTAGAEQSTFNTPTKHGVGLNSPSGGLHYCRRFLAKS